MIWRVVVAIAGLAVVAAATHVNVLHAGGYENGDAWLIITVAALLALGMAYAAICWQDRRYAGAIMLGLCLVAGEVYWLATNAEREIAKRDEIAAPLIEAQAKREKAEARVVAAKAAVAIAGNAEESRLSTAIEAQRSAAAAAVSEAAKPGCRANCANLLMDAKDRAEAEVRAARAAVDAARAKAESEVNAAEAALAAMPAARSAAPLPAKLGLAPWAWDLIMAGLRSIAVVGGSIAIALALHPHHSGEAGKPKEMAAKADVAAPDVPKKTRAQPATLRIAPPKVDDREHVAQFLRATLRPDPEGSASLRRLHARYADWCEAQTLQPLPPAELGHHLRTIVDAIGLEVEPQGKDVVVRGAALAA